MTENGIQYVWFGVACRRERVHIGGRIVSAGWGGVCREKCIPHVLCAYVHCLGIGLCKEEFVLDGEESGKSAFITYSVVILAAVKGEGTSGVLVSVVDDVMSFVLDGGSRAKVHSLHIL